MTVTAFQNPRITRKFGNLSYVRGTLILVGGTASEVLALPVSAPADANLVVSRSLVGGTAGIAQGSWTFATQTVNVLSANALDTSTFEYILFW
jgi:hypothetical protein